MWKLLKRIKKVNIDQILFFTQGGLLVPIKFYNFVYILCATVFS